MAARPVLWTEGFQCPDPFVLEIWCMSPVVNWIAHSSNPQSESHFNWFLPVTPFTHQIKHKDCTDWKSYILTDTNTHTQSYSEMTGLTIISWLRRRKWYLRSYTCFPFHNKTEKNCVIWIFSKRCSPVLSRHSFTIMLTSCTLLFVVEIDGGE